jgi:hypothetical protein
MYLIGTRQTGMRREALSQKVFGRLVMTKATEEKAVFASRNLANEAGHAGKTNG